MFLVKSAKSSLFIRKLAINHPRILPYSTAPLVEQCPFQGEGIKPGNQNETQKKLKFIDTPEEFANSRPLSEMPGPSAIKLIKESALPSGRYYQAGLKTIHERMFEDYGDVVKFPGLFGRSPMIFLYDADQVEKVFRNEGQYPDRRSFEFMQDFRVKYRPELFAGGYGGLLTE